MKALHARKDFIENHPKKIEICRMILDAKSTSVMYGLGFTALFS